MTRWYLWSKEVGSNKVSLVSGGVFPRVPSARTLGECVPTGWIEAKDIRIWDRREERYQSKAERIGGGNPLFFILPHREMRELILKGLHLFFFSPSPSRSVFHYLCLLTWSLLPDFNISISYAWSVSMLSFTISIFHSSFSFLLFDFPLSLILPHPSLQGLWVYDAW